jgi:signal transduction histidine kinase
MTMRAILTSAVLVLVAVALSASAALVVLTTALHRNVSRVGAAVESVQLADELHKTLGAPGEIEGISRDPARRQELGRRLQSIEHLLERAHEYTAARESVDILDAASRDVEAFLDAVRLEANTAGGSRARGAHATAQVSVRAYSDWNLALARAEEQWADRWDGVANAWGLASAGLLLGVGTLLVMFARRLLTPLLALGSAISRFAQGDRGVRVAEQGPAEMRDIARSFNDMAAQLERQQEERLAFLAGVAHDLRNPLSAIRMATHALAAPREIDESRLRSLLDVVQRQITRIDRMATDFLEASRIEAGQVELVLEDRDLRDVARAAVALYAPASPGHAVGLRIPDAPVVVRCDSARLDQVVNNLVSNAIKYSPEGGRVDLRVEEADGRAVLSVTDEGVGIAPEDVARIFQPFRRGTRLRDAVPGLGLGLATSRRIMERHGGRIEVVSHPRRGSTFRVILPLSASARTNVSVRDGLA